MHGAASSAPGVLSLLGTMRAAHCNSAAAAVCCYIRCCSSIMLCALQCTVRSARCKSFISARGDNGENAGHRELRLVAECKVIAVILQQSAVDRRGEILLSEIVDFCGVCVCGGFRKMESSFFS